MSPGSLYYHWANQEKYVDALVGYVLDGLESHHCAQLENHQQWLMRALLEEGEDFDEAVRDVGDNLFTLLTQDPSFSVQVGLWASQRGNSTVSDRLREIYRTLEEQWIPGVQEVLERQSRVMREPFDMRMFATIMISLAEGLLLREKVDAEALTPVRRRDSPSWSLFSTAVLALYMAVTVPIDDPNEDIRDTARGMAVDRGRKTGNQQLDDA